MNVEVLNREGKKVSELTLKDEIYGGEVKEHLFYEVVKMQLASRRAGTASTKTKAEVSGGGAKPWKQKGTGRARSGSIRSPLWRHGGTVFGPKPRDYSYSVPKKVVREALKAALKHKAQNGAIKVYDSIDLDEPKTRKALNLLNNAGLSSALIVVDGEAKNLALAVRNLKDFKLLPVGGLNVYDVLGYDTLVITKKALEKVEAMIS